MGKQFANRSTEPPKADGARHLAVSVTEGRTVRDLFYNGFSASTVIIIAVTAMITIMISYLGKYYITGSFFHLSVAIFSALLALSLLTTLGFRQEIRTGICFLLFGAGFAIYSTEIVLVLLEPWRMGEAGQVRIKRIELAKKQGLPFDTREQWEVVKDLRQHGHKAYPVVPNVRGEEITQVSIDGRRYTPLAGIGNATIVNCNDQGEYAIFDSDEFGFNNPTGLLKESSEFDIVFLGDSFTAGACVPQDKGFVNLVRKDFPRALNLGNNGSGPLFMLARLKEFLNDKKVKFVFWMFYEENDLGEFGVELTDEILTKYLRTSFRQNLLRHQAAINSALASWADTQFALKVRQESGPRQPFFRHLGLVSIRGFLYPLRTYLTQPSRLKTYLTQPTRREADLDRFLDILRDADSTVKNLGGKMIFVFLPSFARYDNTLRPDHKNEVLRRVASERIGILDIDDVFRRYGDPLERFSFRLWGHYDEVGNSLIAKRIMETSQEHLPSRDVAH